MVKLYDNKTVINEFAKPLNLFKCKNSKIPSWIHTITSIKSVQLIGNEDNHHGVRDIRWGK